ncbi:MAG TPA: hypothetical protein VF533_00985 [Solirubrobacteraceae bacterium]|jgi:hypothetical protein
MRPAHIPEPLWTVLERTEVDVALPARPPVTVRPGDRRVPGLLAPHVPLFVITAGREGEPAWQKLVERASERQTHSWRAVARDPADPAGAGEDGLALRGLDRFGAIGWGAALRRPAIFEVSESGLAVLPIPPRRAERPIHYLWLYDPATERVEISRDFARPRRDRGGHAELADRAGHPPQAVLGKALVKRYGYRILDAEDAAVAPDVRDRVARALVALEVEEGFRLPERRA